MEDSAGLRSRRNGGHGGRWRQRCPSSSGGGSGGGGGLSLQKLGGVPPGMLYVLRKTPCNGQVVIEVDLAKALMDPRERPLVMAGDTLILRYKCEEEAVNFGLAGFFTYGLRYLFQNN